MSNNANLYGWDFLIVVAYLIVCLIIGFYRSTKIKTSRQFALGYQNLSTTMLICVIFASIISSGALFGYTRNLYLLGFVYLIGRLFLPVCYFISAKIYAPGIKQFEGCLSVSQIMYKLYGAYGRWVTSITAIILGLGILVNQIMVIGHTFHYLFGIKVVSGMLLGYGILTAYTALGGIRAVVLTETFQFGIFFLIIPISYIIALADIGGMPSLIQNFPVYDWKVEFTTENLVLLASIAFLYVLPECTPPFIQRCLMATNSFQLVKSLKAVALLTLPFAFSLSLIVYIVKAQSPETPADKVLLFYMNNYLPLGLKGLMVAGIIAAIMGFAEAWLNTTAVIVVNDIVKVLFPDINNSKQLVALRVSIITLSITALILASLNNNIIGVIWMAEGFWLPFILVPLTAGFLGFRTLNVSYMASTVLALILTLVGRLVVGEFAITSLSLGILGSTVGFFGMHYWQTIKAPRANAHSYRQLYKQIFKAGKLFTTLKQVIYSFIKQIEYMTTQKEMPYQRFAVFTLIYYFTYTLNLTADPAHKILCYLLIVGYIMCFVLLLRDIIVSQSLQKKYLAIYWYCTITFCLPTVSSYMLFASRGDDFWIINGLLSAFSLYFFVDAVSFVTLFTLGGVFGYGLFLLNDSESIVLDTHYTLEYIGYIYLFFLFAYLMLFRSKEKEQEDKIEQMYMLSGAIAHEVKTPISSMVMSNQVINEILGKTIKTIKQKNSNKYTITIDKDEYDFLIQAQQSIQKAGAQSINTINSILTSLKSSVVGDEKKLYLIEECIKQTIEDYSLFNSSAKDIEIDIKHNFKVMCSLYYLTYVLINLLKNSYKHGGEGVKIKIWTKGLSLHFKDYGKGIAKEHLPNIFDRFYTKSKTGTGIGLAFCKMVMEDLGGKIECKSELGKYTEFILMFPRIDK